MMEQAPRKEQWTSSERELIRLLKEKGRGDPEVAARLNAFIDEQERLIDASPRDSEMHIRLLFHRARLYHEAGCREIAAQEFADVLELARHERRDDLYHELEKEIATLQ